MGGIEIMKRMLMAEQWDQFARAVLPKGCSIEQRTETRRAFYAGAAGILFRVIMAFAPENDVTDVTDDDIQIMTDLRDELDQFAEMVKQGRA
jgi:hypothetical protein